MRHVDRAVSERAADLTGVAVRVVPSLPGGMWGAYDAASHTIYLLESLGPLQARSTLAHEIVHARYRHEGHAVTEHEATAEREAAADLIGPVDRLADAVLDLNVIGALAIALGVMPRDVRAYLATVPGAPAAIVGALQEPNPQGLQVPRPAQVAG